MFIYEIRLYELIATIIVAIIVALVTMFLANHGHNKLFGKFVQAYKAQMVVEFLIAELGKLDIRIRNHWQSDGAGQDANRLEIINSYHRLQYLILEQIDNKELNTIMEYLNQAAMGGDFERPKRKADIARVEKTGQLISQIISHLLKSLNK